MNSPIDLAYEHCVAMKRAGMSPRAVLRSLGDAVKGGEQITWLHAVKAIELAIMLGRHLPKPERAAA